MSFDFNKLDDYKKLMESLGIFQMDFFTGEALRFDFDFNDKYFELWVRGNCVVNSYESFEVFKKEVASYFLNN